MLLRLTTSVFKSQNGAACCSCAENIKCGPDLVQENLCRGGWHIWLVTTEVNCEEEPHD